MSIIEESKKAKGRGFLGLFRQKKFYIIVFIMIAVGSSAFFFLGEEKNKRAEVAVKEWTVKKDDITIAIEADGKVVAEDGVELSFSVSGDTLEVEEVFIKEGDKIKKGDKVASVKTDDLQYDLNKAYASYQSVLAGYNEKVAGATEEEIAKSKTSIEQAEITLAQAGISLEKVKTGAREKIAGAKDAIETARDNLDENRDELTSEDVQDAYEDLIDTIKSISISLEGILPDSDQIIGVDNKFINDDFESNLGVKDVGSLAKAQGSYNLAKTEREELDILAIILSIRGSYAEIDAAAEQALLTLEATEDHLYDMQMMLNASITSPDLTQTELNAFKATINANRTSINTKITTLNTDTKAVKTAKEDLEDYVKAYEDALDDLNIAQEEAAQDIANSEASLATRELSLEQVKLNHQELLAPLTASELASARSSLTTAAINVDKARNDMEKAVITSPIDGEVAMLNYKTGDIILKDDTKPVVVIINNDTLFIEVNIEEADINKVKAGQVAKAEFDALGGLKLAGEISFISLTSQTNNSGIVTYLVRVIIDNSNGSQIREGMTAFVDFITAEAEDVLTVPVSAVRNINGKPSVELATGEIRPVTTGFTDGKYVEVISGVEAGDKIVY